MGFEFSYICDLLSSLESNCILKATTVGRSNDPDLVTVANWFRLHQKRVHGGNTDHLALLSCMFPDLRRDRTHGFKEPSLVKIIGRCLALGSSRMQELQLWKSTGRGDLGQCVENVLKAAENQVDGYSNVTVEEVDIALNQISARCRFSAPDVRRQGSAVEVDRVLGRIFRRLKSRDAKWFTRLLLKEYTPVEIPQKFALQKFHFLLPSFLLLRSTLKGALEALCSGPLKKFPSCPDPEYARLLMGVPHLAPEVGTKVGRAAYYKARSLKHCCRMANKRLMSIERKYDGEYCQVHIDLETGSQCIRIFSKSGKDSTVDRKGIHGAIRESLRIRKPGCRFSKRCILEGELLVWSDIQREILPFHHLRRHIKRSGTYIGTENDSPPKPQEHLYIVFFDLLLLDDNVVLTKPYRERRALLAEVVKPFEGIADIAPQFNLNFSLPSAYDRLKEEFSQASARKWEGIVLKGAEEPYFRPFSQDTSEFSCCWIKFKKESIPGLGDTADFVLIGGRYDSREAAALYNIKGLSWTSFFIGCLDDDSDCISRKPTFRVVDILNKGNISIPIMQTLNQLGQYYACSAKDKDSPFSLIVDQARLPDIQVMFRIPFIVEMTGFGFDKPQGARYYSLRFPRIVKIHNDRDYDTATSFNDLQELARVANSVPEEEISQEVADLAQKLDHPEKKVEYIIDNSENSATTVAATSTTTSLAGSSQSAGVQSVSLVLEQAKDAPFGGFGQSTSSEHEKPLNSTSIESPAAIVRDAIQPNHIESCSPNPNNRSMRQLSIKNDISQSDCSHLSSSDGGTMHVEMELDTEASSLQCQGPTSSISSDLPPVDSTIQRSYSFHSYESTSSKKTSSLPQPTLTRFASNICGSNSRSTPMKESPLTKFPVFLGSSLQDTTTSLIRRYIPSCRSSIAPSSVSRWINSLVADTQSSEAPFLYGIVLVDSNSRHSAKVADELCEVIRTVAALRQCGKLPSSGKIIFMHWKVVGREFNASKAGEPLDDRWKRFGKDVIDMSIKWGFTELDLMGTQGSQDKAVDSQSQNNKPCDISCLKDWTEILPLLAQCV